MRSPGGPSDPPRQPLQLWVAHLDDKGSPGAGQAKQLLGSGPRQGLNTVFEDYSWIDDDYIVACVLPEGLAAPPARPPQPPGPRVQDNSTGKKAQNRTFPDLLKASRCGKGGGQGATQREC